MSTYETLDAMFHQLAADIQADPGPHDGEDERQHWSRMIDEGIAYVKRMNATYARAEWAYRKAKAQAWDNVKAEGGRTAKHQEDEVNARSADHRYLRDLAQGEKQGALDSLRSRSSQLSAWQTDRRAGMDEADHAIRSPDVGRPQAVPPPVPHPAEGVTA